MHITGLGFGFSKLTSPTNVVTYYYHNQRISDELLKHIDVDNISESDEFTMNMAGKQNVIEKRDTAHSTRRIEKP